LKNKKDLHTENDIDTLLVEERFRKEYHHLRIDSVG